MSLHAYRDIDVRFKDIDMSMKAFTCVMRIKTLMCVQRY